MNRNPGPLRAFYVLKRIRNGRRFSEPRDGASRDRYSPSLYASSRYPVDNRLHVRRVVNIHVEIEPVCQRCSTIVPRVAAVSDRVTDEIGQIVVPRLWDVDQAKVRVAPPGLHPIAIDMQMRRAVAENSLDKPLVIGIHNRERITWLEL